MTSTDTSRAASSTELVVAEPAPADAPGILTRLARWLERDHLPSQDELRPLFEATLTDMAANRLAKQWGQRYLAADGDERRSLLAGLVRAGVELEPRDDKGLRLFRRLYAQNDNLNLLVDLRADMLRWRNQVAGLGTLEQELRNLLSNWFDVGMLELRHINWDSPASLLEKLIQYEAVHQIQSWEDLRRRVADDRRCYAFFHPRMSDVPLIFVEVAFSEHMADNVQALLDPATPMDDLGKARWAIFYSISNTQPGLRSISFGNFLLKRVIDELLIELPRLKSFATLSPIPGFVAWLERQDAAAVHDLVADKADRQAMADDPKAGQAWVERLRTQAQGKASDAVRKTGLRLVARYLTTLKNGQPIDPVARFHLGNGARIERINWAADVSVKGLAQSCAMMVNYSYEPDRLDDNLARLAAGKPRVSRAVQWL
ncbi:MAG TPA: malonyl-CoA decarboxylase family protein [Castellaniella sp.]|nr:malonyl-CoA decarboxylase family protein [Castellaniella sp.]